MVYSSILSAHMFNTRSVHGRDQAYIFKISMPNGIRETNIISEP
jgi:hypothetical protein